MPTTAWPRAMFSSFLLTLVVTLASFCAMGSATWDINEDEVMFVEMERKDSAIWMAGRVSR